MEINSNCHVLYCENTIYPRRSWEFCSTHYTMVRKYGSPTPNKTCSYCGKEYVYYGRHINSRVYCPECFKVYYPLKNSKGVLRFHNITPMAYMELIAIHNGACALCHYKPEKSEKVLQIDHDHKCCLDLDKISKTCGKCIRGLLCYNCNAMIGHYEKNKGDLKIQEFDNYLNKPHIVFIPTTIKESA